MATGERPEWWVGYARRGALERWANLWANQSGQIERISSTPSWLSSSRRCWAVRARGRCSDARFRSSTVLRVPLEVEDAELDTELDELDPELAIVSVTLSTSQRSIRFCKPGGTCIPAARTTAAALRSLFIFACSMPSCSFILAAEIRASGRPDRR